MTELKSRFMSNNFLEMGFTYSSQFSSSFPASNVYGTSRARIWKTGGNFEITASNQKLYINDGTDKTITLTVGTYIYSSLATHIQTQLNASSSNWTCTYNSTTCKFAFTRSSGTKIFRLSQTSNACWDTIGYTQTLDQTIYAPDESRIHTSEWLKCDKLTNQEAGFMALLGEIDSKFCLSTNAVVKLQANNFDDWTLPAIDVSVPVEGGAVMAFFDDEASDYRFWRMQIIDRLNPLGPTGLTFSYAYIGDYTTIEDTNIATGFSRVLNDPSISQQSENGALFFQIRPRFQSVESAQIQMFKDDDRDTLEQLFYDLGVRTPFFLSIDPGLNVSTRLIDMTRLMIMTQNPSFDHVLRGYYNLSFSMREAF